MRRFVILIGSTIAAGPALAQAGSVTLADFQTAARTRLMQADSNQDGRIARAEWTARARAAAKPGLNSEKLFDRLDANSDGVLDGNELDALLARRFARMDANGDGMLTAEERRSARGRKND
jgi:hypothetical protein